MTGEIWARVHVTLAAGGGAEVVANCLLEQGAGGVEVRDRETLIPASGGGEEVIAYFPLPGEAREEGLAALRSQVAISLGELAAVGEPAGAWTLGVQAEVDPGWAEQWRRFYRVLHASARVVVRPAWEEYRPTAGEVVVTMDPGQAFGTGNHATTRLCLSALDDLVAAEGAPPLVLDVGTGSGILAVAAALLGVPTVVAVDCDPVAVEACRENAVRNGVADRVEARLLDVRELSALDGGGAASGFPLVLANLQTAILRGARDDLAAVLAPGGRLVLSGILEPDLPDVLDHYRGVALLPERVDVLVADAEWAAVVLRAGGRDAAGKAP